MHTGDRKPDAYYYFVDENEEPVDEEPEDAVNRESFDTTDSVEYARDVQQFQEENPELGAFLSDKPPEKMEEHDTFVAEGGDVGVAVSPEGDAQNVFNQSGKPGAGRVAVEKAIDEGAVMCDCYETGLEEMYATHGFEIVGRMDWEDDYAPDEWNYDEYGEPDVVFMAYMGEEEFDGEEKTFSPDEWAEAKQYSKEVSNKEYRE